VYRAGKKQRSLQEKTEEDQERKGNIGKDIEKRGGQKNRGEETKGRLVDWEIHI
jgi:hypothetical protein